MLSYTVSVKQSLINRLQYEIDGHNQAIARLENDRSYFIHKHGFNCDLTQIAEMIDRHNTELDELDQQLSWVTSQKD